MSSLPIDHGWAWMCTLGASVCMFFFVGIIRSLGVVLVEVVSYFRSSSAMGSLVLGLMGAGVSLTAPLGNAIGARYDSYRSVIIFAAMLIFLGTLSSAFTRDALSYVIVYGIMGGIGLGMIIGPAIVTVGMYFDKRRAFANGLATAGGSVGQLVIPLLTRFLFDTYSFRGGILVFAAIGLHFIPAALLLRPLSFYDKKKKRPISVKRELIHSKDDCEFLDLGDPENDYRDPEKSGSVKDDKDGEECEVVVTADRSLVEREALTRTAMSDDASESLLCQLQKTGAPSEGMSEKVSVYSSHMSLTVQPPPGQLPVVPKHAPWRQVFAKTCCCCCIKTGDEVVPLIAWRLFRSKVFLLYLLGVCLGNSGYLNALFFFPPYATELRASKTTASLMLSAVGVADLVSRIVGGWFGDLGIIPRHRQVALSLLITGATIIVTTSFSNFISAWVMLGVMGLLGGFYLSLLAVVVVDLMGLANLSPGYGVAIMMQGLTNIFVPTVLGYLRDVTGTYRVPLYICGSMMVLGGIAFTLQPLVIQREAQKKHEPKC